MAATELATAYLSLVPSMRGAQGAIARELSSVDADGIGKGLGSKMGGGLVGTFKSLVGPALAVVGATLFGGVVAEAARASDATDKFKGTLDFAGVDTSGIEKATAAAKAYADQTVYDLPTIQATMAQLAANGVDGYLAITEAAGNLNAVAGGNAETFQSVSRSLTQSAGAGKLMTEDWNMLADAIPGASGALQKSMLDAGAYTGNFKTAMEKGEITAEEFQAAITELGSKPVAVEAAKSVTTFEGALGNLNATIMSGVMGALDALKPQLTGMISGVSDAFGAVFSFLGGFLPGIRDLFANGDITGDLLNSLGLEEDSPIIGGLFTLQEKFWEVMTGISDFMIGFKIPTDILVDAGVNMDGLVGIGASVRDVFNGIKDAVAPLVPDLLALWSAASPVSTIFAALQPSITPLVGILGSLAATVGGSLAAAISGVLPAVQSLQAVFVDLFMGVLATALPLIAQLVGMVAGTLSSLIPILVPIIVQVATLAATLVSQLAPIFMSLVSAVLPMVVSALGSILAAVGPLVQEVGGMLIPIIQALLPVVVMVFSVAASVIQSAMQIIQGIIQVVTGIISGNWSQVFQGLGNIVSGAFNLIVNLIRGALGIIGSVVIAGLQIVGSAFMSVFNSVSSFLGGVWGNITSGVSGMIGSVVGFFSGLIGRITGAIGNAGGALLQVGKDIVQGLINGIGSMMGAIGRAVINIVPEAIRGPFESLLGIASPSKVFRGYGHNIGEGLVLGIGDMYGAVAAATEGLAYVPGAPEFASSAALTSYAALAVPADTARSGPLVEQNVYPSEKMSEENLAEISARKIAGALT